MSSPLLTRFEEHALARRIAVSDVLGEHGYREIWDQAGAVAHALVDGRDTLDGERIALLVAPGAEFIASIFGVWRARGCAVVLSPLHPAAESSFLCEDAGVRTIIASPEWTQKLGPVENGRKVLDAVTARSGDARAGGRPALEDAALMLYTSGTTGRPKGAILTHDNLATQQRLVGTAWGMSTSDVLLHALPLHHMHGLAIALFTALGAGARVRMLPNFDAAAVWNEMVHATVFMGVPTMYSRLCDAFDREGAETRTRWVANARALRVATSGSAALPVPLATRWEAIAGIIPVERFGMTEIGVGMTNPVSGPRLRKKGTVGWPLPTVETRIVDEGNRDAETGELWIRGPSVFVGYHGREDATREAFAPATDGGAPWFKTGDTVTRDEDGAFRILGRTSVDILKSGGYKLSALEIEAAILELDAVHEVAVVGVADETWGERVVACIVPTPGREAECTEANVRAHVRERLAPYKCPKEVRIVDALPRNTMGKVMKRELAKELSSHSS